MNTHFETFYSEGMFASVICSFRTKAFERKRRADLQILVVLEIMINLEYARAKSQEHTYQIGTKNVTIGCKMPCSMKKPNTDFYSVTTLKMCGTKKRKEE